MKKLNLIFIVLMLFSIAEAKPFKGKGLKVGLNIATQDFNYKNSSFDLDTKNINGMTIGGYIEWFNSHYYSLSTEIYYIQKGMKIEQYITDETGPEPIGIFTTKNYVNYISVPVLAKMIWSGKYFSPFIVFGPRFDFMLSYDSDHDLWNTLYDDFNSFIIGGDIGLGVEKGVNERLTMLLEFRYSHDITDAYDTKYLSVKNRSMEFLFGVRF